MGVDISGSIVFGVVFNREYFRKKIQELVPDFYIKEDETCFEEAATLAFSDAIDVRGSVDVYSGEDWRNEIYVFLFRKGARIGCKGGDCELFDKDNFTISQEEEDSFKQELTRLGFTFTEPKWIFRTYLS
jgi:hypothetical protein